jgi:hypothetical protein
MITRCLVWLALALAAATGCEDPVVRGNVVVVVRDDTRWIPGNEDGFAAFTAVIRPGEYADSFGHAGRCEMLHRPGIGENVDAGDLILAVRDTEYVMEHGSIYYPSIRIDRTLIDVDELVSVRSTGGDISRFEASVHVPAPLEGVTMPPEYAEVSRSEPFSVAWNPIDTDGADTLVSLALTNPRWGVVCYAEPGDNRLEVPVEILAQLADGTTGVSLRRYREVDVGLRGSDVVFRGQSLVGGGVDFVP